jgi:hypothetical protein
VVNSSPIGKERLIFHFKQTIKTTFFTPSGRRLNNDKAMTLKHLMGIVLVLFLPVAAKAQQKINLALKQELDSIYVLDQQYRHLISLKKDIKKADSIAALYQVSNPKLEAFLGRKQNAIDSSNLVRVEAILKQYGYPGKTLVGTPTNETVFFVLQHSPKIKQYVATVEQAARKGELPFRRYAMMQDRLLMQEEKEQLYGTQVYGFMTNNPQTGKPEWQMFVWPIKNPKTINKRRRRAGLPEKIEDYAKRFDLEYKVVTLEAYKKMKGN